MQSNTAATHDIQETLGNVMVNYTSQYIGSVARSLCIPMVFPRPSQSPATDLGPRLRQYDPATKSRTRRSLTDAAT